MPAPSPAMLELTLADLAATERLAGALAGRAKGGDVIGLAGGLGLGKTAFARAFIAARARGAAFGEVPSPTFTLVQVYDLPETAVWHFDLYRIAAPEEAWELGVEEAFADAISLVEWPDRLGPLLPAARLDVEFAPGPSPLARRVRLVGHGEWAERLAAIAAEVRAHA
ncbi:MAG: tRNA (adenosine(37)-N6)-threonylcarbamoyltransferase complex ATPase subunit type 1 TsaE [Pseudomonadota bacterium]